MATSTFAVHSEKITHAVNVLSNAGLSDISKSTTDESTKNGGGNKHKTWIIVGATIGSVVLLVVVAFVILFLRRGRKGRAYRSIARSGVLDGPQAPGGPGMTGGLMPLWMTHKQQQEQQQATAGSSRSLQPDGDDRMRRYSQGGPRPSSEEVFDADREDPMAAVPSDSMRPAGPKIGEKSFGSDYEGVDTGYEAKHGLLAQHGDRRSQM